MFWYILTFKTKMAAPKWPLTLYWETKTVVFQYFMNEIGRRAWANEVYFPPNSEVSNLIEWYLLYFRTVLTIKFKMIAQNWIILTFKIQDGLQRHIENQKKKVLSLEPNVPKKQIKQLFILSLQPRSNGKIFTVFWDHLTFKSEMATQFVCLFISPLTWDTQSETIQEASVLSWGPVASDAIFRYITVISLEPDVSLRPRKCHFLLILALQIC